MNSNFDILKATQGFSVKLKNGILVDKIEHFPNASHDWKITAIIGNRRLKYTEQGMQDTDKPSNEDLMMCEVIDI